MTAQNKDIPVITSEEDIPFLPQPDNLTSGGDPIPGDDPTLGKEDDINKEITRFRYHTGGKVLYISIAAMGIAVILDLVCSYVFKVENALITNAFEAFKLITMTVLGYIFGSNAAHK